MLIVASILRTHLLSGSLIALLNGMTCTCSTPEKVEAFVGTWQRHREYTDQVLYGAKLIKSL
jgi:hypothetical protein